MGDQKVGSRRDGEEGGLWEVGGCGCTRVGRGDGNGCMMGNCKHLIRNFHNFLDVSSYSLRICNKGLKNKSIFCGS